MLSFPSETMLNVSLRQAVCPSVQFFSARFALNCHGCGKLDFPIPERTANTRAPFPATASGLEVPPHEHGAAHDEECRIQAEEDQVVLDHARPRHRGAEKIHPRRHVRRYEIRPARSK